MHQHLYNLGSLDSRTKIVHAQILGCVVSGKRFPPPEGAPLVISGRYHDLTYCLTLSKGIT